MWTRLGYFELPADRPEWWVSHCQLPTPLALTGNRVRVYFAARTAEQRSQVGWTELELNESGFQALATSAEPGLTPGPAGCFDEHGVYPSCVVPYEDSYLLYYVGWIQGAEPPMFYAAIGLATSRDGLRFERHSPAPLVDRGPFDPCLVTSPHVYREGPDWRMTYVSGLRWERDAEGKLQSHYHIKSAWSTNPFEWQRQGRVAVDFQAGETNLARSWVVQRGPGDYAMWYSYVKAEIGRYRIGYAESSDGATWERADHRAGIDVGDEQAQQMIAYPSVVQVPAGTFLFYNGDRFGAAGFGVARWTP